MTRGITLMQAQRWSGSLAAVCAFLACAVSGEVGPALLVAFPIALVLAHFYGDRFYGKAEWAWTTFLAGALLVLGAQVVAGGLDIVLGAARFSILLAIHRLWHRRTERDELLLLLLTLLMMCAGAALSAELLFGFSFLAFSVAGTWALALTHLRFAIEQGRGPQGSAALLQSKRLATPGLLGGLAALSLLGIVGAALVFFLFPRVTIGGLRRPTKPTPVAGLSDRVELRAHGIIADDPRVVLRVRLDPDPGSDTLREHWRARALEVWTGSGWRSRDNATPTMTGGTIPARPERSRKWREHLEVADIEAVAGFTDGIVLTPEGWPINVEFHRPITARGVPQRLYRNMVGDLFYQPVDVGDLSYTVTIDATAYSAEQLRGRGRKYPRWVGVDLQLPENLDPRIRDIAQRLAAGKDPADAASAVENWLTTSFKYTRELAGEQGDPIAHFLFDRKEGHCELFSSAMVLILRAAGIPARNVTGYYGGQRTSAGYFAVRAGDAHSWVEVYFPGAGFVAFDPTPASERGGKEGGLWASAVLVWDAIQQRWRAFIVDYDILSQANFAKRVGAALTEAGRRLSGKGSGGAPFKLALEGLALAAALVLVAQLVSRTRFGRALKWRRRGAQLAEDQERARKLWRTARTRLAKSGIELAPSATVYDAANAVAGHVSSAMRRLADAYSAARWGERPLPPDVSRRLLRELRDALEHRP